MTSVSQATLLIGSSASAASRMVSEIWSAILSGWPSVTDSEVKRCEVLSFWSSAAFQVVGAGRSLHHPYLCLSISTIMVSRMIAGDLPLGGPWDETLLLAADDVDLVLVRAEPDTLPRDVVADHEVGPLASELVSRASATRVPVRRRESYHKEVGIPPGDGREYVGRGDELEARSSPRRAGSSPPPARPA